MQRQKTDPVRGKKEKDGDGISQGQVEKKKSRQKAMGERHHRDRKVTRRKKGRDGEKLRQK